MCYRLLFWDVFGAMLEIVPFMQWHMRVLIKCNILSTAYLTPSPSSVRYLACPSTTMQHTLKTQLEITHQPRIGMLARGPQIKLTMTFRVEDQNRSVYSGTMQNRHKCRSEVYQKKSCIQGESKILHTVYTLSENKALEQCQREPRAENFHSKR